jgi:hypothetical protein
VNRTLRGDLVKNSEWLFFSTEQVSQDEPLKIFVCAPLVWIDSSLLVFSPILVSNFGVDASGQRLF